MAKYRLDVAVQNVVVVQSFDRLKHGHRRGMDLLAGKPAARAMALRNVINEAIGRLLHDKERVCASESQ